MIRGSCLCQQITYEYDGPINELVVCHCNQCKRAQGTPFATNAPIPQEYFVITQGSDLLKTYFSSPNKKRVFCSHCGSPLYSQKTSNPDIIRLRLGTVTEGTIPLPDYEFYYEIYCESKSSWFDATNHKPGYEQNKT